MAELSHGAEIAFAGAETGFNALDAAGIGNVHGAVFSCVFGHARAGEFDKADAWLEFGKGGRAVEHEVERFKAFNIAGFHDGHTGVSQVAHDFVVARHHIVDANGKLGTGRKKHGVFGQCVFKHRRGVENAQAG